MSANSATTAAKCASQPHTRTRVACYERPRQALNTGPPAQTSTRTCHFRSFLISPTKHHKKFLVPDDHLPPTSPIALPKLWIRGLLVPPCFKQVQHHWSCPPCVCASRLLSPTGILHARRVPPPQLQVESVLPTGEMSRSRKNTLVDTLAPPSPQICATLISTANPLLPSTPAVLHTRCPVVAKDVEGTATPQAETTQHENLELF